MDYIIPHTRILNLIDKLISTLYPDFSDGSCEIENFGDEDDPTLHYFKNETFATYNLWRRELRLKKDLFLALESYLGEKNTEFVIDWFNREFSQDAESVGMRNI